MIKACYNSVDCYELFSFSDDYKLCLSRNYRIILGDYTNWMTNQLAIVSKNNNKCLLTIPTDFETFKKLNNPQSVYTYLDSGNLNFYYDLVSFFVKEYNFDLNENINYQFIELIHNIVNNLIFS